MSLTCKGQTAATPKAGLRGPAAVVPLPELSIEDKRILDAYQHSVCDEVVDVDLVYALCLKIHTAQPPGETKFHVSLHCITIHVSLLLPISVHIITKRSYSL